MSKRYARLRKVITECGWTLGEFAVRCGIEAGYFSRTLANGEDFTPEEFWSISCQLGIASNVVAQDELFFEDDGDE